MVDQDQIDFIIADLDRYTRDEVIRLTFNVAANLREEPPIGTPIHTGWASANWVTTIGDPYDDPGIDQVREPTAAQVAARAAVADASLNDVLNWTIDAGIIFVTNNVPYIRPLNEGHSPQSPPGFVQAAIDRAVRQTSARVFRYESFQSRAGEARESKARPRGPSPRARRGR